MIIDTPILYKCGLICTLQNTKKFYKCNYIIKEHVYVRHPYNPTQPGYFGTDDKKLFVWMMHHYDKIQFKAGYETERDKYCILRYRLDMPDDLAGEFYLIFY